MKGCLYINFPDFYDTRTLALALNAAGVSVTNQDSSVVGQNVNEVEHL